MRVPSKQIHEQLVTVFRAWGMSDAHAETTAQMMVETDEPLCQIALACGLCDQAHLSRVFRRRHGVSPGAWRRAPPLILI